MEPIEHPSIFSTEKLIKKGLCSVAQSKERAPEAHNIYYELHGTKDEEDVQYRVVLIMGLNASSFAWSNQLSYFASIPNYQCLVFDNRGVGNSDSPPSARLYKTSEMALDTIELLDYLGWTGEKSVNVVGVSMGGMIAQHCALLASERVASLVLISTTADNRQLAPLKGFKMFAQLSAPTWLGGPKTDSEAVSIISSTLFPLAYLNELTESGCTRREIIEREMLNRARITKLQTAAGRIGQMSAALSHYITPEQCKVISEKIGRVLILTGDEDNLVAPENSQKLHELIPGSELIVYKGAGHALPTQKAQEINELMRKTFELARNATL